VPPADDATLPSMAEIDRIVAGTHHDPHSVLGAHPAGGGIAVRALRPLATSVTVVLADGRRFPAAHVHSGVFAVTLPRSPTTGWPSATRARGTALTPARPPRSWSTTRTGTCPPSARLTCT
jgi:hypothetical protein